MAAIDISAVNTALGAYHRQHSTELTAQLMLKPESFDFMTPVPGVKDQHTSVGVDVGEVTQAYQCAFVPKKDNTAFPIIGKVHPWMIDLEYDCMDDLERSYMGWVLEEKQLAAGKPTDTTLGRFLWSMAIEKALEEREIYAGTAERVTPTPGTAGDADGAWDGFLTIIADLITAGAPVNIIPTGSLAAVAGTFDKIEGFVKGIHPQFQNRSPFILSSHTVAQNAMQDFRAQYPYQVSQAETLKSPVFLNTQLKLKGLTSMASSKRLIYTEKRNFLYMFDFVDGPSSSVYQVIMDIDKVKIRIKGKLGFKFKDARHLWVNDQA